MKILFGIHKTYLNNSRASSDSVVRHCLVATSQYNVGLTGETLWYLDAEATLDGRSFNEGRSSDCDKGGVNLVALDGVVLILVSKRMKSAQFYLRETLTGVSNMTVAPVVTGVSVFLDKARTGKALTGSFGLLFGQEVINGDAREYTSSSDRGVSNG